MTDHGQRRFRRRRFNQDDLFLPGRFDSLTHGERQTGLNGWDEEEWHDMREAAGLVPDNYPHETFGVLDKDGIWHEQLHTTSGRMLGWLSQKTKSTATTLFRWVRGEFNS